MRRSVLAAVLAVFVRAAVRRVLLFSGLVFVVWPVGSALAQPTTTVGRTGTPIGGFLTGGHERVQTDAAIPAEPAFPGGGVGVTGLNTQSSSSCGPDSRGTYDFQVLRPLGGDQYRVVLRTGNLTDPCDGRVHSYPAHGPMGYPVAVEAGDVLGVYVVHNWQGVLSESGSERFGGMSEPGVGQTVTVPNQTTGTLDESATVLLVCQEPGSGYRFGFESGFNSAFNSGWHSEFRQAYRPHGAWQVGWQRGLVAGRRVHAVRESAQAARPAAVPASAACDFEFNQGFNDGFKPGFNSGFNAAYKFAFNQGYRAGFAKGRAHR